VWIRARHRAERTRVAVRCGTVGPSCYLGCKVAGRRFVEMDPTDVRIALRTIPSDDVEFRAALVDAFRGVPAIADDVAVAVVLEAALRDRWPEVLVTPSDPWASVALDRGWYAYRNGLRRMRSNVRRAGSASIAAPYHMRDDDWGTGRVGRGRRSA
jgi:hypothetical protein